MEHIKMYESFSDMSGSDLKTAMESAIRNPSDSKPILVSSSPGVGAIAMIREIANDLGYTFHEIKLTVKRNTGLCFTKDKEEYCKSFADCDVEDLNLCIQECIRLGDDLGIQLR